MNLNALKSPVRATLSDSKEYIWGAGGADFVLFAGPDIIESPEMLLETAKHLKKITDDLEIPWILKCSFDKANRQSITSYRGPGQKEGLAILDQVKKEVGCALITDLHECSQVEAVAQVADVIQIPAFLCRQTDLVVAAAKTGKVLHIKKGQFMAPGDMAAIIEKAASTGNQKILLADRGTSFGYNRLINDFTGLVEMRSLGVPVVFDATHSVQLPGAGGGKSGGKREMVSVLARAAVAVGVDGLFMETHPNPQEALCDGPNSIFLSDMEALLRDLQKIARARG